MTMLKCIYAKALGILASEIQQSCCNSSLWNSSSLCEASVRRWREPGQGYLGDKGAVVGKVAEFRGELKGEVGERQQGLGSKSQFCSFQSSSSFSMDRRLFTLDSFCSDCCSTACSLESCLQGATDSCSRLHTGKHTHTHTYLERAAYLSILAL